MFNTITFNKEVSFYVILSQNTVQKLDNDNLESVQVLLNWNEAVS